eukprot:378009_1
MGQKLSNKGCDCVLQYKYNHCCKKECFRDIKSAKTMINMPSTFGLDEFIFTKKHCKYLSKALSSLVQNDDFEFIVQIIASYFNSISDGSYYAQCHGNINKLKLCPIWSKEFAEEIKVVLLGETKVGKSSVVMRYLTGNFIEDLSQLTEDDSYRKTEKIDENEIIMDILDTAPTEEFTSMRDQWLRERQMFLIVFAINDDKSLQAAEMHREKIMRATDIDCNDKDHFCRQGLMLIGTKLDLKNNPNINKNEMKIMEQNHKYAMKLSNKWNVPYIQVSSKENINIGLMFKQIIYEYWIQTQTKTVQW